MTAQLLVSVRNVQEAIAALSGGADIIDVKEPAAGSLGAASPDVITEVVQRVRLTNPAAIVSAAMGEVSDGNSSDSNIFATWTEMSGTLDFMKSGLSGLQDGKDPRAWKDAWTRFRQRCSNPGEDTHWVAVSYADWKRSASPSPLDVLAEGREIGSPILLVDTFKKDNTNLVDWLDRAQLQELRTATSEAGMKLALAGRITVESLPEICECSPDVVAIRGAACEQGNRTQTVTAERVRAFRVALACHSQPPLQIG